MPDPELHRIRDASITVVDATPKDHNSGDAYEIQVFGVSVLIRRRARWGPDTDVPYIHIENQGDDGLLLVEVNNSGEHEHRTRSEETAA
ncbi:hypothetical protein ACH4XT_15150 [Streptomyces avidinii]|uniref:hypothetical protein n=1 Tax=Streptomyces avidinii TaxID=1895 RepID=UPI0037AE82FA